MKKFRYFRQVIFVMLMGVANTALAQDFQVGLAMSPNPSPFLSDWEERTETVTMTITNLSQNDRLVKVKAQIFQGSALRAETNTPDMPAINVQALSTHTVDAAFVIPLQAIELFGTSQDAILQTGKIPAGNYQICVVVVDAETEQQLTQPVCRGFNVTSYNAPILILPPDEQTINLAQNPTILFSWTPVTPNFPSPFRYVLQVFEVLTGQDAIQAFQSNQPVLEQDVVGTTQFLWPADIPFLEDGQYIWSVRVLDEEDRPITAPDGYAEPFTFSVTSGVDECACPDCSVIRIDMQAPSGDVVSSNASESASTVQAGQQLVFTPVFQGLCPEGCPSQVEGQWQISFAGEDGNQDAQHTGGSVTFTPPSAGRLQVYFVGRLICGENVCDCEGEAVFNCDVGSGGTGGSVDIVDKKDTIRNPGTRDDTVYVPTVDSIPQRDICLPIPPRSDPGSAVSLGMILDQPDKFPYPRAAPIRADAKDMDYAIFSCQDCGGPVAEKWVPVPDSIASYDWTLTGPGSLNTPFDLDSIKSLDDSISAINKRISEITDSLNQLEADTARIRATLEAQQAKAKRELPDVEKRLAEIDTTLQFKRDSVRSTRDSITTLVTERGKKIERIKDKADSIRAAQKTIDSVTAILRGEPSDTEKSKLEEVNDARDELADADSAVARKDREIQSEAERLDASVKSAADALSTASDDYQTKKSSAEGLTDQIAKLRERLYAGVRGWNYFKAQRSFDMVLNTAINTWFSAQRDPIGIAQESLNDRARQAVSAAAPAKRTADLATFRTEMTDLITLLTTECGKLPNANDRTSCLTSLTTITDAAAAYDVALDKAVKSAYRLDPAVLAELATLQAKLRTLERSIETAEATVQTRARDYQVVLRDRNRTIKNLERDRTRLAKTATSERKSLEKVETAYYALVKARVDDLERNREQYLQMVYINESTRDMLHSETTTLRDSIALIDADTTRLSEVMERLEREIELLEEEQDDLETIKANLETILAKKVEDLQKPLVERMKVLEKEKEDLEKQLEELKKQRANIAAGTKVASGPIVYYVPPPLEEVMKDKPRFEELKDTVDLRERELTGAIEFKGGLQGRLTRLFGKIAREAATFKESEATVAALKKEMDSLDVELSKTKNQKTRDYQDQQQQLQDVLTRTEAKRDSIRKYREDAKRDSAETARELENVRNELDRLNGEIATLRDRLTDLQAQLDFETEQRNNASNTLEGKLAELKEIRDKLLKQEDELAQLRNEIARNLAKDNLRGEGRTSSQIRTIESTIATTKTQIESLEASVQSTAGSYEAAERRVQAADSLLQAESKQLLEKRTLVRNAQDSLVALNERLQEALNGLNHWKYAEEKANDLIDKTNAARREFQDTVASLVNNDEEVKAKADAINEIKKQIEEAEKRMKKAEDEIDDALAKRDELMKEADDSVKAAETRLATAEKELRDFLVNEFNTVTFTAKLISTVKDAGFDGFRTAEGGKSLTKEIRYVGSRVPAFDNEFASGGLAARTVPGPCIPDVSFTSPGPISPDEQEVNREEPRTIALVYREGKPLWPEWPVIPSDAPMLTKDVVELKTQGKDSDTWVQECIGSEVCPPEGELRGGIKDLVTYEWSGDGKHVNGEKYQHVLWETPEVEKPDCTKPFIQKTVFTAAGVAGDKPVSKEFQPEIEPGVLIEIPDSLVGASKAKDTIKVRIVTGDHKGLSGEDVEFTVAMVEGDATDYGLDGTALTVTKTTDADGYATVVFNYGEGFAKFDITTTWARPSKCTTEKFPAVSPLYLQFMQFTTGSSNIAWETARKIWTGTAIIPTLEGMPEYTDSLYASTVYAVAGYHDENRDPVNDVVLKFTPKSPGISCDPDSTKTELFGILRTDIKDAPEEGAIAVLAECESKYEPVCRPPEEEKSYNTSRIEKFRIGDTGDLFTIVPNEPVSRGEPVNGVGTMEIAGGKFVEIFKDVELTITDVILEEDGNSFVAVGGTVSWKPSDKGLEGSVLNFTVALDSLVIRAGSGAGIGGNIKHPRLDNAVSFYAEMNTGGEFYGEASSLPEISVAKFTLKEGSSFAVDMHGGKSDKGFADGFRGIVIRQASLELPPVFNGQSGAPSTLSAKDFAISSSGFEGSIALTGSFIKIGYAGYEFQADSIGLKFKESKLTDGGFSGRIALASPMEGKLRTTIGKNGDEWGATVMTDDPISIPRLKTTFSLRQGTGITWNSTKRLGTLRLNATINSEKFGDIEVTGFEFNSKGEIKLDNMSVQKSISVAGKFDLYVQSLSFIAMGGEYGISMTGGLQVPAIGLDKLAGTVTVSAGPTIGFRFDSARIHFERGPVEFAGMFAYSGREFRGDFDVGIKKLAKGIKGSFIVGSREDEGDKTYTYWYAEMALPTAIPMGQTGLALTEIGGGVGWNYDPPVGLQEGTPRNTDAFSFKAIIGVGNVGVPITASGKVFAGRLTMVLTQGRFTLNGKVWALDSEENMYGEGQLNVRWDPIAQLDGYVRMLIALPDAEGEVFYFNGKVNFLYNATNARIRSEFIRGSILKKVNAEAHVSIDKDSVSVGGRFWYDLNKEYSVLGVGLALDLHVSIAGGVKWDRNRKRLDAGLKFAGNWDVNIMIPVFGTYDLVSGKIDLEADLTATERYVQFEGSAYVEWDLLGFTGSKDLDVGFKVNI